MEFSAELHTIKTGWSIVYIETHGIKNITKLNLYLFSEDRFFISIANSAGPVEILCLPKVLAYGRTKVFT